MSNLFGKSLRAQMDKLGVKESELAEALSYDATYISKWINGSKLPSVRNADRIIEQLAEFFAQRNDFSDEKQREHIYSENLHMLKNAFTSDSSYQVFQGYGNNQMSFLDNRQTLIELTRRALMQEMDVNDGCVNIVATFDIFNLYGKEFKRLIHELRMEGVKQVKLKFAIDTDNLAADYDFYTSNVLGIIGYLDYIEMSIVSQKPDQPQILVIGDLLCLQVLWETSEELAAVFSMDRHVIKRFSHMCNQVLETAKKLLDPAVPESLKQTNVQLDSYSDRRQWLFFNEPPALLFPEEIMDMFIEDAEDEGYANYLMKLKNVFTRRTCKSKLDLVLYSSMMNKYLSDGCVSVGNVSHTLTEEQTRDHIRHLSKIMTENPEFHFYLMRDTVLISEEQRRIPSIFIDTYSLTIENSKKSPNENYHISMDPAMRDAFQKFYENMVEQSYCTRLTAEDLQRYL